MVATVISAKGKLRQETLAGPDLPIRQAMWGADDSIIFALVLSPTSIYDSSLLSIGWPSREMKTLLTGPLGNLDVAEETGAAVVPMAEGRQWQYDVWVVPPGGKPKRTPITIPGVPTESRISPNGRYLAAVLGGSWEDKIARKLAGDGGLVVYDIVDGSEYHVSGTQGKRIAMAQWVLEGKALVFTIIPKGGHPGNPDALAYQLWLVRMPWWERSRHADR
jgi:dipeptidyl aminopeptidase/acylaminoacyl peptidase